MREINISNSTQRKIAIFIAYFNVISSVIITLFYTPFLFKTLGGGGEEASIEYGIRSFVESITVWLFVITNSMASAYVRFATIKEKEKGIEGLRTVNLSFFILFLISSIVSFIIGISLFFSLRYGVIPLDKYNEQEKSFIFSVFLISLASVFSSIVSSLFSCYIHYRQKFIWLRSISLIFSILKPCTAIFFLFQNCNVVTLSLIYLVVSIGEILSNFLFCLFYLRIPLSFRKQYLDRSLLKEIVSFSSFILVTVIVDEINQYTDQIVLGFLSGPKSVTVYQLGMTFCTYLTTMSTTISGVFIPKINKLVINGDREGTNNLFLSVSKIQMIVVFTVIGGFACCGYQFVYTWVGEDKIQAFLVAIVLFLLSSFDITTTLGIEIQRAMNKQAFRCIILAIFTSINIAVTIVSVYFLPDSMDIVGCLIGTAISVIGGSWICISIYNQKIIKINMAEYWLQYLKMVLITGACCGASFLIYHFVNLVFAWRWGETLTRGCIFLGFYLPAIALGNLKESKALFSRIKTKIKKTNDKRIIPPK